MKEKIVVTGGTGYIGSHTVVELQQKGYEVLIIDNLSNSFKFVLDNIEKISGVKPSFYNIDICDSQKLHNFFSSQNEISGVIHFAAFKAVNESVENPLRYYQNNLYSLINLLDEMKKNHINHLVFSSSCTVYGQPENLPVSEDAPLQEPASPYGHTKRISEDIIRKVGDATEIHSILLRYFNPIGAHESAFIGELPIGIPNNLVPYITQTAIGKRDFLRVFGNDYNTPDGSAIRDYIHVVDLAKAHVIALERLLHSKTTQKTEVYNLGTGKGYSVLDAVKTFEKVSGKRLNYKIFERRPGDIEKVWADTNLANEVLGWKAELNLEDMMLSAWIWEQYLKNSGLAEKIQ